MRLIQWLWHKAEQQTLDNVIWELMTLGDYHRQQAEIMYFKDKYEPVKDGDDFRYVFKPLLTSKEHSAIATAVYELAERLMPPELVNDMVTENKEVDYARF